MGSLRFEPVEIFFAQDNFFHHLLQKDVGVYVHEKEVCRRYEYDVPPPFFYSRIDGKDGREQ